MERIVKIGIIGCGGIANGKHFPALSNLSDVEMVAFCDIVEERAIEAKEKYGTKDAKHYTDYKELLKDDTIEVIHVLTPNRSHSFITIDALEAGKHVMCEKPMAKTYEEAKAMVEASKRTGKMLTVGYQNRGSAGSQYIKTICKNGELGEIYYAKARALRRRGVPTWGVFLNEYEQGGGPLIDIGTHALDLTLWMMDNYKPKMVVGTTFKKLGDQTETANGFGEWDPKEFTVEDSAFGFVVMEGGATIILESSWALNTLEGGEAMTTLCGTLGGADMLDGVRINYVKNNRQIVEKPDLKSGGVPFFEGNKNPSSSDFEARVWINAVKNGTEPLVLAEEAAVVTQILEAIYTSANTGKPVMFD